MKLIELFTQRAIIDELIKRKTEEIEHWVRENIHLANVQLTVFYHGEIFEICASDTEMKDDTKGPVVNTVFRDLFIIRNFQIINKTDLFKSYSDSKKKEVLEAANKLIKKWEDK